MLWEAEDEEERRKEGRGRGKNKVVKAKKAVVMMKIPKVNVDLIAAIKRYKRKRQKW